MLFVFDIVLNFRTTYINPKTNMEVVDPKRIAKNYFYSTRFIVDVSASIPFEQFVSIDENAGDESTEFQLQMLGLLK